MPPTSVNIFEEGAEIVSFKIVDDGVFNRDGMLDYLVEKPSKYPGCSGCRNIRDVESDLKAVGRSCYSMVTPVFIFPNSKLRRTIRELVLSTLVSRHLDLDSYSLTKFVSDLRVRTRDGTGVYVPYPR